MEENHHSDIPNSHPDQPKSEIGFRFDYEGANQTLFTHGYTDRQKDSIEAILAECDLQGVKIKNQVAYMLATPYHECFNPKDITSRMTYLHEWGGEEYLKGQPYYPYYGRGFSHLTWLVNYEKESKRMNLDLVNNPDLMLDIAIAANSHVFCMMHGTYTGVGLPKYVNSAKTDFPNARRIINGTDQAEKIAGYASQFSKYIL